MDWLPIGVIAIVAVVYALAIWFSRGNSFDLEPDEQKVPQ